MASRSLASEEEPASTLHPESYYRKHHLNSYIATIDCFRVQWPIIRSLSEILIANDATDPLSATRPYFDAQTQTFHPIAKAYATYPPVSSMSWVINCLVAHQCYVEEMCECEDDGYEECQCPGRYISPEPLIISNPQGVTIGDVIAAGCSYFEANQDGIFKAESVLKGDGVWEPHDDDGNIRKLPANSRLYVRIFIPGAFSFQDVTGNEELLAALKIKNSRLAVSRKDKGYIVFAAEEIPERITGRMDAVPMTE